MSHERYRKHVEYIKTTSCVCLSLCELRGTVLSTSQKCCWNQSKTFPWKNVDQFTTKKGGNKKEQNELWGLCCWWERCITCFRGRNHRAVGASMWFLSQWGNTDQVVQWAKAGVVKSSSEKKKLHFTWRNKVSLCGLRAQAVFPLQMWAALCGSLSLC